jgi:hypothetical protein
MLRHGFSWRFAFMLHRTRSYLVPILGLAATLTCTGVQAGMVSYNVSTGVGLPNYAQVVAVPAFNSSLGTLTQVTYSFTEDVAHIGGTLSSKAALAVQKYTISDTVVFTASFDSQSVTNTLSLSQQFLNVTKGETVYFGGTNGTTLMGASVANTITGSGLSSFEGTTPLNFDFTAAGTVAIGGTGGNANTSISTSVDATLSINYFFTPSIVPEPASLAMTALGGLLVLAAGYVRSRSKAAALRGC